ncbi:MAG: hypothetical protein D6820_17150, partial [Lentisphaerae bacterium]
LLASGESATEKTAENAAIDQAEIDALLASGEGNQDNVKTEAKDADETKVMTAIDQAEIDKYLEQQRKKLK